VLVLACCCVLTVVEEVSAVVCAGVGQGRTHGRHFTHGEHDV